MWRSLSISYIFYWNPLKRYPDVTNTTFMVSWISLQAEFTVCRTCDITLTRLCYSQQMCTEFVQLGWHQRMLIYLYTYSSNHSSLAALSTDKRKNVCNRADAKRCTHALRWICGIVDVKDAHSTVLTCTTKPKRFHVFMVVGSERWNSLDPAWWDAE